MGKLTISTGPFSSSQTVSHYQRLRWCPSHNCCRWKAVSSCRALVHCAESAKVLACTTWLLKCPMWIKLSWYSRTPMKTEENWLENESENGLENGSENGLESKNGQKLARTPVRFFLGLHVSGSSPKSARFSSSSTYAASTSQSPIQTSSVSPYMFLQKITRNWKKLLYPIPPPFSECLHSWAKLQAASLNCRSLDPQGTPGGFPGSPWPLAMARAAMSWARMAVSRSFWRQKIY